MFHVAGRIARFRPVHNTIAVESEEAVTDRGSLFPVIGLAAKISIEELLEVIVCPLLVYIVPFLCVVNSKPARYYV